MFVPHGREDAKFGEARFTPDEIENALIFVRLQTVGLNEFRRDFALIGNSHRDEGPRRRLRYPKTSAEGRTPKVLRGLFNLTLPEARQENADFPAQMLPS